MPMKQTFSSIVAVTLLCFSLGARSDDESFRSALRQIQHEWEVANYQLQGKQKEQAFAALVEQASAWTQSNPGRAEPLIWQAIVRSGYAGAMGGVKSLFKAMPQVKQARDLLLQAQSIDPGALDGSAWTSLGSLYYKVPGWPVGFGDKKKARDYLRKALEVNPDGIDPNFFYGELLAETGEPAEAKKYLQKALQAPPRPERPLADQGRQAEINALLDKL